MISVDGLILFAAASAVLAIAPGPDNIFVLTHSALHGYRAGLCVTAGLCTGLLGHIAAVALGVSALLQTSAFAFVVLKIVGAGYLLYLAWHAFRAGAAPAGMVSERATRIDPRALYLRGVIMNVTNPKVAIFFMAFLPQFIEPDRGAVAVQVFVLGMVFMSAALIIFSAIAWCSGRLGRWLGESRRAQSIMNRLAGSVFVLLAGRLVLSSN